MAIAGFTACMLPSLPVGAKLGVLGALVAQPVVFKWVGMHNEGDWAHLLGFGVGLAAFFATRRMHPAWKAALKQYNKV